MIHALVGRGKEDSMIATYESLLQSTMCVVHLVPYMPLRHTEIIDIL